MNTYRKLLITICTLSLVVSIGRSFAAAPIDGLPSQFAPHVFDSSGNAQLAAGAAPDSTPLSVRANRVAQGLNTSTPTRTPTPINVGNFVWDDFDQDGRQDAGEPGLAGVTVQLWNGAKTALIDQDTTNSSGIYSLVAPTPGDYRVRVLLPNPSLDEFSPKDNIADDLIDNDINPTGTNFGFTDIYTFGSNLISITSIDAGIIVYRPPTPTRTPTPINIGNFVWHDLNGDGVQTSGEPGVAGVTVQLWNAAKTNLVDQKTTNSNGNYTLVAPLPGDYRVRVLLPTGASFTLKDQGADTTDSDINRTGPDIQFTDAFNLASNVISITTKDAGLINVQATATPTNTPVGTLTNTPTPVPLITVDDAVTLLEDTPAVIDVTANDSFGSVAVSVEIVSNPSLGSVAVNANQEIVYTPSAHVSGADSFTYRLVSGSRDSLPSTVSVTILPVNDAPLFTNGTDVIIPPSTGPYNAVWATNIAAGPADEAGQTVQFAVLGNTNPDLFLAMPSLGADGTLQFTMAPNQVGTAIITVVLSDDGGTANGGVSTSAPQSFAVIVTPLWHRVNLPLIQN